MEGLAKDLGKTFIEKLINKAIKESRYIFCFSSIVKEFDEEKLKLKAERKTMGQRFKVANEKDKDIPFNAHFWEEQVDILIQEDTKSKQKCFFGFCPDCIWRYKRGKELATKTGQIKQWMKDGEKHVNVELTRPLPDVERYSSQYYIPFKSRELKHTELLDALKDENIYLIGLCGMGGTGKTTLAKEVGKHLKGMNQFDHVIDTTVSNTPNIKKIQDDIAGSLGLKWEDCNESDRPKKLWSRLTNGEKILVILDDVWGDLNFDDIGIPHSDNHNRCRVLITTRYLWLCHKMTCGKTFQLELLDEEDAWIMFKMYADIKDDFSLKSFHDKGREISIECKRLPVAIATVASSLKGKQRQEEWDAALTFLKKPISMDNMDNDLVGLYKCLKFSYDNMKDERAKILFLLCSIFQEDKEISVEVLTRLAIGVSLFGDYYSSYEDVRGQAIVAKNKLLDSCLLLETEKKDVKMHDMVREVALWIANKEIRRINFLNKDQKLLVERDKNIKYLFCEGKLKDLFSSKFDGSKLELLFVNMDLFEFIDVPISFLKNIKGIQVLILIHNVDMVRPNISFLQSIWSLMNIHTLIVQNVTLGNISILGNLLNLETLDLVRCNIDNLPCEIENLEKLRLLNLESCNIECNNPFEVIQNCSSLEVLYFCDSFNEFCKEITLPALKRYHVLDYFDIVPYSIPKYVGFTDDYFTEATYKYLIETTEVLKFQRIEREWRNLMPEIVPIDKGMNELVEIHLRDDYQLRYLVDTKHIGSQVPPNVFSKLVVLHLEDMKDMEALGNGSISLDSLSNLEKLTIERCELLRSLFKCRLNLCNLKTMQLMSCSNMVSVFELSTAKSLLMLEKLEISDCGELENIFTNDTFEKILDVDDNISFNFFPELKVVDIKRCHKLQFILPLLSSECNFLLESITIEKCDSLKYIFGQYQHVKLDKLTEMKLDDLPNFIDICPESPHSTMPSSISKVDSNPQTQLQSKKSSKFSWRRMCCYGNKFRGTTTNTNIPLVSEDQKQQSSILMVSNLNCLSECFSRSISAHIMCNIKEINLCNFSKKKSAFILSVVPIMSLESLTIRNCDELKHIIVDIDSGRGNIVFPKLKFFEVTNCKKLEYIFGHINVAASDNDHHQHEINETITHLYLPSLKCLKLCSLPSLIGMCTKNYRATLPTLMEVEFVDCSHVDIKSFGDFNVSNNMLSIAQESTPFKESSENMEHFLFTLKSLVVKMNSKLESIFCFNEVNEQKMNLTLEAIKLDVLPMMTSIFVGPKDIFTLHNLTRFEIKGCEKLKMVFPTSIIRYLPHMQRISIEECNELTHIIEDDDDLENKKEMSRICFPKLTLVIVKKCNKLKSVFPISVCKELPRLKGLVIREANELEEIFKSDDNDDDKVEIPNLKIVVFDTLPSLFHAQRIYFHAVEFCTIHNCETLSLTSALSANIFHTFPSEMIYEMIGFNQAMDLHNVILRAPKFKKKMKQTPKAVHEFVDNVPDLEKSSVAIVPTNSKELINEQSMNQHPLGKIDTTIKHSQGNNLEGSTSEQKIKAATMSTISETKNEPTIHLVSPKLKGIEKGFVEGTTTTHFELGSSSSTPFVTFESKTSSHEDGDGQRDMTSFPIATTENNDEVKERSIVEHQSPKGDEIIVFETRPSFIASQFPSMPFEVLGESSETIEDLSSSMLVTKELEELVSKKHLDYENLYLLTDFLVKNPWVRLRDTSLGNRYKGCAYKLLAELLKFVQTHSVLDVLGSCQSEFVELLRDARNFAFDKEWLDGVEKRALFPNIQVSQNALKKLLDSKQQVTKDIEVLRLKIDILSEHVEDLKHQLTSSEAVLESITQQEMALSAPIGY